MKREDLLGKSFECSCGERHTVPIRRFLIERGAINAVTDLLNDLKLGNKAFLLADPTTFEVAGRRVEGILEGSGIRVNTYVLPEHPRANEDTVALVGDAYTESDVIISCGSGTITDLAKNLANDQGIPIVAVATAPSMNGYASSVVALMGNGVKTTRPVRPAVAVIADLDVMARAPMEMIRAGLGDALAKPVCNADWKLASLIRGNHFCETASELVRDLESGYVESAADIGSRDFNVLRTLIEALLYSGVSMVLAGSTAPTSGGEHLISHTLDMRASIKGVSPDFHGAQVGVATLITSQLYERIFELSQNDVKNMLTGGEGPGMSDDEQRIRVFFDSAADSIIEEMHKKRLSPDSRRLERERIAFNWDRIRTEVAPFLVPSAKIRKVMRDAGCKTHYSELGLDKNEFMEAVYLARTIRPKYNILELAWELGLLEQLIKEVV